MSIWRWAELIDSVPEHAQVSLGEGDTPVIRSRRIGPIAGLENLYFKLETTNPGGSFKDRFGAAAISHMVAAGKTSCIATSSGNTGSALAACCAAAGLRCRIAIVEGAPLGKLKQMLAYGAEIARIRCFGVDAETTSDVLQKLHDIGRRPDWALQVSAYVYCPAGMSGVQTIAYELAEQAPEPINHVFCPAGGGGLCVAVARGFQQLVELSRLAKSPRVHCVQPTGNDTISGPLRDGLERAQAVDCTTKISGLQVASVVDGDLAIQACRQTGGTGHLVPDDQVWKLQKRLAREEGVFSEPAGAIAVAAALDAAANNLVKPEETVVCLVTGSGFKDDASIEKMNRDVACPLLDLNDLKSW